METSTKETVRDRVQRETSTHPILILKIVKFRNFDRQKMSILYYKGDILSLWLHLSELFQTHDYENLFAPSTLTSNPHLAYLLVRHMECAITLKMLNGALFSTLGLDFDTLFHLLGRLGDNKYIDPEIRARAMALRVVRTFGWESGKVAHCWADKEELESASPITLQLKLVREIEGALHLHERFDTQNAAILHLVLCLVKRSLPRPFQQDYATAVKLHKTAINRDDLFATFVYLNLTLRTAIERRNRPVIRAMLRMVSELKLLGEWGMLFSDWWKRQENEFAKQDVWKKEWESVNHATWEPPEALFSEGYPPPSPEES